MIDVRAKQSPDSTSTVATSTPLIGAALSPWQQFDEVRARSAIEPRILILAPELHTSPIGAAATAFARCLKDSRPAGRVQLFFESTEAGIVRKGYLAEGIPLTSILCSDIQRAGAASDS